MMATPQRPTAPAPLGPFGPKAPSFLATVEISPIRWGDMFASHSASSSRGDVEPARLDDTIYAFHPIVPSIPPSLDVENINPQSSPRVHGHPNEMSVDELVARPLLGSAEPAPYAIRPFDFCTAMEMAVDLNKDFVSQPLNLPIYTASTDHPLWYTFGTGLSSRIQEGAESLLRAEAAGETLSPHRQWNLDTLRFVNNPNADPKTFVAEANVRRMHLADIIDSTKGKKDWSGRSNVGDSVSARRRAGILKHYAPDSCLLYFDINNHGSRINRKNPCISPWLGSIPRSMHKEAGGVWNEKVHRPLIERSIFFVDLIPLIPFSKPGCKGDFKTFASDAESTLVDVELSGFLIYNMHGRAHELLHDEPMTVAVATRECWKSCFDEYAPLFAPHANVLGMLAHGQCWSMRKALKNQSHPYELIEHYSHIVLEFYSAIARINRGSGFMPNPLRASRVAQRFGGRNDDELDPEERQALIEDQRLQHDQRWNERYSELLEYKKEHGHADVPQKQGALGSWVHYQRQAKKAGQLSAERIAKLEKAGFRWSTGFQRKVGGSRRVLTPWDERYAELLEYKKEHGDVNVRKSQGGLGRWVTNMREHKKAGTLSAERIAKLETAGFRWHLSRHRC